QGLGALSAADPETGRSCAYTPGGRPAEAAPAATATPALDLAAAQALLQAGQLEEAEAAFAALGGADRGEALHGLGLVRFQHGDAGGALKLLEAAEALAPTARLSHNIALLLHRLGRRAEAIERQR